VIAANETPESRLEDSDYFRKIFQLDEHVGCAIAGLSSDARVLINQARVYCQSNKLLYDEPVDLEGLARRLGDIAQIYTQHAGVRPFGVSMILAGLDKKGSNIYTTDPSGSYRGFKAAAIGRKSDEASSLLADKYKDDLDMDEAINLAIEAIKAASEGEMTSQNIKVAIVPADTRTFRRLSDEEVDKYL
jgi:proteasome alpha subunit